MAQEERSVSKRLAQLRAYVLALMFVGVVGGSVGATIPLHTTGAACVKTNATFLTFPAWYRGLPTDGCELKAPDKNDTKAISKYIWTIVFNGIEITLQLIAYLAVFYVIFGGYRFIRSALGMPEMRAMAMKTIANAITGLVVAIAAISITRLMTTVFIGSVNSDGIWANASAGSIISAALDTVYWIFGALAVVAMIVSGLGFITSSGNPQKAANARNGIVYAAIGLAVVLLAAVITGIVRSWIA